MPIEKWSDRVVIVHLSSDHHLADDLQAVQDQHAQQNRAGFVKLPGRCGVLARHVVHAELRMSRRPHAGRGKEVLEFRAYPSRADKFSHFRVPPLEIGPRLLSMIDSLHEHIPLPAIGGTAGLVLGVRRTR